MSDGRPSVKTLTWFPRSGSRHVLAGSRGDDEIEEIVSLVDRDSLPWRAFMRTRMKQHRLKTSMLLPSHRFRGLLADSTRTVSRPVGQRPVFSDGMIG